MAAQSGNILRIEQVAENDVPLPVNRIYNCPHCDRSFNSSQAVAGHCKGHYSRNQTLKPPRQRGRHPESVIPAPAVQPLPLQTVLPQLPNRERQLFYNHNPQYQLYQQRVQVYAPPQFPAYYVPFTESISASPVGGMMNNFERGLTSNGNQARDGFGEQNDNGGLDLALHL